MDPIEDGDIIDPDPLLIITLFEDLDPNDGQVDYEFTFNLFSVDSNSIIVSNTVNVIIHEIGKLLGS